MSSMNAIQANMPAKAAAKVFMKEKPNYPKGLGAASLALGLLDWVIIYFKAERIYSWTMGTVLVSSEVFYSVCMVIYLGLAGFSIVLGFRSFKMERRWGRIFAAIGIFVSTIFLGWMFYGFFGVLRKII